MFFSSIVRLFALAALLLACLARAQTGQPAAAMDQAGGVQANGIIGGNGGLLQPIQIKNDVSGCTAFVTGHGCGEIVLAPFQTVTRAGLCRPNHAHIRCASTTPGNSQPVVVQCNAHLNGRNREYTVEGIAGDACTLVEN